MPKKFKVMRKEHVRTSMVGNVLAIISIILLLTFSAFMLIFEKEIYAATKNIPGVTEKLLLTYGIIWIILAGLVYVVNKQVRRTNDNAMKWFLFVLGIVAIATGRFEGILIIASSLFYLMYKNETKQKER